jgi:hypothetical protein
MRRLVTLVRRLPHLATTIKDTRSQLLRWIDSQPCGREEQADKEAVRAGKRLDVTADVAVMNVEKPVNNLQLARR